MPISITSQPEAFKPAMIISLKVTVVVLISPPTTTFLFCNFTPIALAIFCAISIVNSLKATPLISQA